jgi:hypothetical protein
VVDDQGQPVTNAHVVAYSLSNHKGEGKTNEQGEFAYFARSIYPPLSGKFRKEGHYGSRGVVWRGPFGEAPAETLSVVLKRILDPVPMERRDVQLFFPVLDKPIGFDFEMGDWVAPHGAGRASDVFITGTLERGEPPDKACGATLVVSNALDGFVAFPLVRSDHLDWLRSEFQPPQRAPDGGYTNSVSVYTRVVKESTGMSYQASYLESREYLFRMRSVTNHLGELVQTHVGWFDRSLKVGFAEKEPGVGMSFSYYYNPDPHSRSLEPKEIADRQGR